MDTTIEAATDAVDAASERLRIAREERDHPETIVGLQHELADARHALAGLKAAPATRKPFTDVTWADVEILTRQSETRGWEGQADLQAELMDMHHLERETAAALIYAAASEMPIVLTWESHLRGIGIETTTATVLVEYLRPTLPGHAGRVDEIRVRYCGFGHPLTLSQVVSATVPATTRSYRAAV